MRPPRERVHLKKNRSLGSELWGPPSLRGQRYEGKPVIAAKKEHE